MKKEDSRKGNSQLIKTLVYLKNAQAWGLDLIFAVTIFIGILVFLYLHIFNISFDRQDTFNTLLYEGKVIGDSLLSEGFPKYWSDTNVVNIGILSDGEVDKNKLAKFYNLSLLDYQRTKGLFNVVDDYYISFDRPIEIEGNNVRGIGIAPIGADNLVKVTRVTIIDKKIDNINIYVWN